MLLSHFQVLLAGIKGIDRIPEVQERMPFNQCQVATAALLVKVTLCHRDRGRDTIDDAPEPARRGIRVQDGHLAHSLAQAERVGHRLRKTAGVEGLEQATENGHYALPSSMANANKTNDMPVTASPNLKSIRNAATEMKR